MTSDKRDLAAIFEQALQIASDQQRAAYLDRTCGSDADARRTLEQMLAAQSRVGSFLENPAADIGVTALQDAASAEAQRQKQARAASPSLSFLTFLKPSEQPGHLGKLGTYEILEVLGQGGMGIVLKAHDPRLCRNVAIKVLLPHLAANAMARQRFLNEARKQAAVSHNHVVAIHAVDEADGYPFIVMEYVVGTTLQERIKRTGPLKLEEILRIGMQAASGLAAAHDQGLVHRDIKPANILLENGVERVKIADFGLARAADDLPITQSDAVAGTPEYMSPEQTRSRVVDARSDLFSLGSVLYAMCTGRSPFRAANIPDAMRRVCEDAPRPIREVNSDIPDWLVQIIDRLQANDPEDRVQAAAQVCETLGAYLSHLQHPETVARPVLNWPAPVPAKSVSLPNRGVWIGAGIATLAVCVPGLVLLREHVRSGPPETPPAITKESDNDPQPVPDRKVAILEMAKFGFHPVNLEPYENCTRLEDVVRATEPNNLANLPPGLLQVDKIPLFFVGEGRIQLSNGMTLGSHESVRGIEVNRTAAKLHFLHGCAFARPGHGTIVARYRVHYEDKSSESIPVIVGRHLLVWWQNPLATKLVTRAKVAWEGTNPHATKQGFSLRLFLYSWQNPHPENVIAAIDVEYGATKYSVPFCVAITCDVSDTPLPPEPGLLCVNVDNWAADSPCSVRIAGSRSAPLTGLRIHEVLLAAGRHEIEVLDGDTVVRRGAITMAAGGRKDVTIDASQELPPLPTPQIEDLDQIGSEAVEGNTAKILWRLQESGK